jgi:hypothetical protein
MIAVIMNRLGFVRTERAKAWATEAFEQAWGRRDDYYSTAFLQLITTAETAKAQRDTLQRLLDRANGRLEEVGMISTTTFIR